jgi:hypothetical protein
MENQPAPSSHLWSAGMEPRHETRTLDLHPESVADDDWSALTEYVSILSEFASAPASILEMLIARSEDRP